MTKNLASVRIFSVPDVKPVLDTPSPDATHFYTAGRILSYFPNINRNGFAFFKEDCSHLVTTLLATIGDIQHVKPGNGVVDGAVPGMTNTSFSAISQVKETDDGIDIVSKCARDIVKNMGFQESDFGPMGRFGSYSQECDYTPADSTWIIVDKDDPKKIVKELSYMDGLDLGFRISHYNPNTAEWDYFKVDDNPVYVRVKPLSFSGVGHVVTPADSSAAVYKMAASINREQMKSFYPGMDEGAAYPSSGLFSDISDLGPFAHDFIQHPDLLSASLDKFSTKDEADDAKAPDDHYACMWSDMDWANQKDGQPQTKKHRILRIKDDKGNLDRKRLVVAYHSLSGMRGNIYRDIPSGAKAHGMALVRQGLKLTNKHKENSSQVTTVEEIADLNAKIAAAKQNEATKDETIARLNASLAAAEAKHETEKAAAVTAAVEPLKTEIVTLTASLAEYKQRELSSLRLAELETILPFAKEEKEAATFPDTVKNLASLSEDRFESEKLKRMLAKSEADRKADVEKVKNLAALGGPNPKLITIPTFDAAALNGGVAPTENDPKTGIGFAL